MLPEAAGEEDLAGAPPFRELLKPRRIGAAAENADSSAESPRAGPVKALFEAEAGRLHTPLAGIAEKQDSDLLPTRPDGCLAREPHFPFLAADSAVNNRLPVVPGYEILGELGRGGMGVIYLARQQSLNRPVALKMVLAGIHATAKARTRFRTEAVAVARLQHPNIVQIYEIGEFDGSPFLALEYVSGGNLADKVNGQAQPDRYAAELVEILAHAVHYMHHCGILHRDLKPTNVLLTANETPKISDFGLAKLVDGEMRLTRTDTLVGTPNYMSPERASGITRSIGASADVYSLGTILYELLTGRAPFHGVTVLDTLEQVRSQQPVPPRSLQPGIAPELETICLKCLEKKPRDRYATAEALAGDLRSFLDGTPIRARRTPFWRQLWSSARYCLASVAAPLSLLGRRPQLDDRPAQHQVDDTHRQFLRYRNEALLYGLLAPDEGSLLLGSEAAANLKTAESAVRQALALAGLDVDGGTSTFVPGMTESQESEVAANCYTLLVVLAGIKAQQSPSTERYEEALRLLDRARQLGFQTRSYHLRRAHFLNCLGRQAPAQEETELARSLPLEGVLDHFLIGAECYRSGNWDQAMNCFNRALHLQPDHFWAQFFLAVCHLKNQCWEAARAGLNACISQQPEFVWTYLFRCFANEKLQALPEAEADFLRALQLNPNEEARYVLLLSRGILRFNQGELERAATDFRQARNLKPEQYNAYLNLAQVYLSRRQFAEAAEQFEAALRLRPPAPLVAAYHVERGRNLLRDERYEEALQACATALQHAPDQTLAHEVSARALLALGRYEQAERSFDRCCQSGDQAKSDIFRGRGLARMKVGKYPEAVEDYTRALELAPDGDIYQHRGWAHFFADAWKLALRDFSKALELDPQAAEAYIGRGLARVMLGEHRPAVADAQVAFARNPGSPEMMFNIACIFAQASAQVAAKGLDSLAEHYCGAALESLHRTFVMLPAEARSSFWSDHVMRDAALLPLQRDPHFKRLQEVLGIGSGAASGRRRPV
jgi:serine/threonine protein kinase/Tfp pilus assembly protein PilF